MQQVSVTFSLCFYSSNFFLKPVGRGERVPIPATAGAESRCNQHMSGVSRAAAN